MPKFALFNPFGFLNEGATYSPHTRTLRTPLWKKIRDGFHILVGRNNKLEPEAKYRFGLLDYFPAFGLMSLVLKMKESNNPHVLRFARVFNLALFVLKACFAFIFLIPALPIIAFTHLVSYISASKLRSEVDQIFLSGTSGNAPVSYIDELFYEPNRKVFAYFEDGGHHLKVNVPKRLENGKYSSDSSVEYQANVTPEQKEALCQLNFFRLGVPKVPDDGTAPQPPQSM